MLQGVEWYQPCYWLKLFYWYIPGGLCWPKEWMIHWHCGITLSSFFFFFKCLLASAEIKMPCCHSEYWIIPSITWSTSELPLSLSLSLFISRSLTTLHFHSRTCGGSLAGGELWTTVAAHNIHGKNDDTVGGGGGEILYKLHIGFRSLLHSFSRPCCRTIANSS